MKKILFLLFTCFVSLQASNLRDKMYISEKQLTVSADEFHIHIGHNIWLVSNSIETDSSGLFVYENNLHHAISEYPKGVRLEYVKKWQCPYCHYYWPVGKPCDNEDCPSRYK
jgi:hypothetical protein